MTALQKVEIMGLDPGSHRTGFGLIECDLRASHGQELSHLSHGVIVLESDADLADRLCDLSHTMRQLFKKHRPHIVVVEKVFLGKSPDSAFKLGHARGVVLAEAAASGARVVEISTRQAKKMVTGTGAADKAQVQLALSRLLKLNHFVNEDASDALALAWSEALRFLTAKVMHDRQA